jgi:hypothetical protein
MAAPPVARAARPHEAAPEDPHLAGMHSNAAVAAGDHA